MRKFFKKVFALAAIAGLIASLGNGLAPTKAQAAVVMADATAPPVAIAAQPGKAGYTLLDANGNVYAFGGNDFFGSVAARDRVAPFVSMSYTPTGRGYALMDNQGHVYNFGDSYHRGGTPGGAALPFVSIAYKPGTMGYTIMDSVGHIYNYGTDYLSGPHDYSQTYTAFAYTPSGNGYTLMTRQGHIYAYGEAQHRGGFPGGTTLPMRGLAYRPGTLDYTELDAVGNTYNYRGPWIGGSPTGHRSGFVGLVYTPSGNGIAMADSVGNVYNYGDSQYAGGFRSIMAPAPTNAPVGNVFADSTGVPCANGTRDLGTATGYSGGNPVGIRLCALPNLPSTSEESQPGTAYYVANANGNAIVNSRVSGAVFALVNSAKNAGRDIRASSSFRTMAHQQALCNANPGCRSGNYTAVARPGTSNHQLGIAIDFAGITGTGGQTCGTRATSTHPVYTWLRANASAYGMRQYSAEAWHWDFYSSSNRC
jgi:hypothetical protein